jgi:uncharacterized protein YqjF (DUF2071 family)
MNEHVFLTAEWRNLIHINYSVDAEILEKIKPNGISLDLFQKKAWISIVAFDFTETRVKGVPVPVYGNFPEINLRYYVTDSLDKNGVVFIREYIPRTALAYAANLIYNEHYKTIDMDSISENKYDDLLFCHNFTIDNKKYFIEAVTENVPSTPTDTSPEHFFKQRNAGFGVHKDGSTMYYDVEHNKWRTYKNKTLQMDVDFGHVFGNQWEFLNSKKPENWFVAEGGDVKVYNYIRI